MNCMLCMSIGNVELLIDITSDEAQRLNVASVLHQHFRFHFQVKRKNDDAQDKKEQINKINLFFFREFTVNAE